MEQDVGKLHITMNNVESPDVLDALNDLSDDNACLFLANLAPSFEKHAKIITIRIFLHHVDVRACFDSLMETDSVGTTYHTVNLDLFVDTVEVLLRDV